MSKPGLGKKWRFPGMATLILLLGFGFQCLADPVSLTLVPHSSLASVTVGDVVYIDVVLGNLSSTSLNQLYATIEFDSAKFGTPLSITPGAIIPDTAGFFTAPSPGIADASYFDVSATGTEPITSEGVFFTFSVQALDAGTGSIDFAFTDAFDTSLNEIVPTSNTLDYTVHPAASPGSAAAPLPPTIAAGILCIALFTGVRLKSRFRTIAA